MFHPTGLRVNLTVFHRTAESKMPVGVQGVGLGSGRALVDGEDAFHIESLSPISQSYQSKSDEKKENDQDEKNQTVDNRR